MCAIAGITGQDISTPLKKMLDILKHRGGDDSGYWIEGTLIKGEVCQINIPGATQGMGHHLLSIVGHESTQPLVDKDLVLVCNGEIYNYKELESRFNLELKTDSDCEVILKLIQKFPQDDLVLSLKRTMDELDGDYAFALLKGDEMVVARDPVGVKPLYYGEIPSKYWAFASERKALWQIGIKEVHSLRPGHVISNKKLFQLQKPFNDNPHPLNQPPDKDILKGEFSQSLINAVEKRTRGLKKVGLIFSGGVDSTLLALILKKMGVETTLYTVGTENSPDMEYARQAAEFLDLKLKTYVVDEEVVKSTLEPVINAIEEFNVMKIGVGMPLYLASSLARKDGLKVVLTGQGADELLGGYHRYLKDYASGKDKTQEVLKHDIENIYKVNLQRDDAVTMAHGVELRVPYLDREVIKVAFNIPMKYKIENENDPLRKHILREVAQDCGMPDFIALRPKKAAQYGSGIHKILIKKVLKNFDEESFMKNLRGF
ncbi:MAG: asparagine synthase (glutamine-hydrolyzing) [Euryarchaeota archaeon]|nr:asparagine synthase (glutamine-hydrolyzing) [Euryarchaeota archaeon]MBV1729740.1 asparagine synthase (glutamine-hydrolyzing) [Methanobacterium sp.]MBU4547496.1 asparagine synthase (glutamine-hydrolyzing) [Euryarchaeota archaeon]MBU4608272.1 asparagine synthase (glutamine-hydrolyzing) [Euryarchaeota archaeon]MBV1755956.1 asparagine synthase (glutamine-hydrolyzing) [Methanobacterium sp.]